MGVQASQGRQPVVKCAKDSVLLRYGKMTGTEATLKGECDYFQCLRGGPRVGAEAEGGSTVRRGLQVASHRGLGEAG